MFNYLIKVLKNEKDSNFRIIQDESSLIMNRALIDALKNGQKLCINIDGITKYIDLKNNTVTEE